MFGSKQRQNCFCEEAGGFHLHGYPPHSTSITAVITAFNFSTAERRSGSSTCNAPGMWPAALRSDRPEADLPFTRGNYSCLYFRLNYPPTFAWRPDQRPADWIGCVGPGWVELHVAVTNSLSISCFYLESAAFFFTIIISNIFSVRTKNLTKVWNVKKRSVCGRCLLLLTCRSPGVEKLHSNCMLSTFIPAPQRQIIIVTKIKNINAHAFSPQPSLPLRPFTSSYVFHYVFVSNASN